MAPVLGYWKLRGRAQCIRLLLAYTETEYKDVRYTFENKEKWFAEDKLNLGLDLPNIPYYIDGDFKISQALSIVRYLGRKHGLDGDTYEDAAKADMFITDLADIGNSFAKIAMDPEFVAKKPDHLKLLKAKLALYEPVLEKNTWFVGNKITYADFVAYEVLDVNFTLDPASFTDFPKVRAFLKRVEGLPQIKKYMESAAFMKWPIMPPFAAWGGKPE